MFSELNSVKWESWFVRKGFSLPRSSAQEEWQGNGQGNALLLLQPIKSHHHHGRCFSPFCNGITVPSTSVSIHEELKEREDVRIAREYYEKNYQVAMDEASAGCSQSEETLSQDSFCSDFDIVTISLAAVSVFFFLCLLYCIYKRRGKMHKENMAI